MDGEPGMRMHNGVSTRPATPPTTLQKGDLSGMTRERLKDVPFNCIETRQQLPSMPVAAVDRPSHHQKLEALPVPLPVREDVTRTSNTESQSSVSSSTNDATIEAELFGAFSNFCAQGTPTGDNQCMDSNTFSKVCRECKIVDDIVTPTMVEIIFQQIVSPGKTHIAFSQFCLAMRTISERKGLETMSLFNQIIGAHNAGVSLGATKKMPSWWESETLKSTKQKVLEALEVDSTEEEAEEEPEAAAGAYEDLQEFSMDAVRKTYFAYCISGMSMNSATAMAELMNRGAIRFCGGVMMEMRGKGLMDSKCFEKLCAENSLLGRSATPGVAAAVFMQVKDDKADKHICFPQFQEALDIVAKRRRVPAQNLLEAIARSKGPVKDSLVNPMMRDYVPGKGRGGGPRFAQPLQRMQQTPLQERRRSLDSSGATPPRPPFAFRNATPGVPSGRARPYPLPRHRMTIDGTPDLDLNQSFPPSLMPVKKQQPLQPVRKPMSHSMDGGAGPLALPPRPPSKQVAPPTQQQQQKQQQQEEEEEEEEPKYRGPATVKGTFLAYCSRPTDPQQQQQMSGAEFAKICRDCSLVDSGNGFTAGMVDNIFCKVKKQGQRRIGFKQFTAALRILAEERGAESPNEVLKIVAEQREPNRVATKAEAVRFYDQPGLQRARDKLSRPQTGGEALQEPLKPAVKAELKTAYEASSVEETREDPRGGFFAVKCMDSYAFSNLCKVSGVSDAAGGPTTVDLIFARVKNPGSRRINFLQFIDSLRLLASRFEEAATVNDVAALIIAANCSSPIDGRQRQQQQQQQFLPDLPSPPASRISNRRRTFDF